eukprot:scpid28194/ scgid29759/ 
MSTHSSSRIIVWHLPSGELDRVHQPMSCFALRHSSSSVGQNDGQLFSSVVLSIVTPEITEGSSARLHLQPTGRLQMRQDLSAPSSCCPDVAVTGDGAAVADVISTPRAGYACQTQTNETIDFFF